ncbi:hypothetical protein BDR03DRAFT_422434 [Suillus americanus]|nr:hypothetical protein BDR03DRAFT_422434 [Suillus americanus]
MQMSIPSVLSVLQAILKCPAWLLQKLFSIFSGSRESPLPPKQSVPLCSLSDSPYVDESAHSQRQRSYEHAHPQPQRSTYPPLRPAAGYSQSPPAHQSPSQQTPSQPYRQQSVRLAAQRTPPVPPDVAPVTEPIRSYIPQYSQSPSITLQYTPYQPHHQPSVRVPAQRTPRVSPDVQVAPVTEPVRSHIPQVCLSTIHLPVPFTHVFEILSIPFPINRVCSIHPLSLIANRAYESLHNARPPYLLVLLQ